MPAIAYFILILLQCVLWVLNFAMLARAVLSWFPGEEENTVEKFLRILTEPIIIPVRVIFQKFGWFQDLPIDVPFLVACILLTLVSAFML